MLRCEVQCTEVHEMESIGARHTALSNCLAGLLCADRQFQVPTFEKHPS